jgi:hypothetical protein
VTQRESFYDADGRSARFRKQFRRHDDEEEHDFDDVEQEDLLSPDSNKVNTKPGDDYTARRLSEPIGRLNGTVRF